MTKFLIIIEKSSRNCSAYCPDLPGCVATGRTKPELRRRIRKAITLHIRGLMDEGLPIPAPQTSAEYISISKTALSASTIHQSGDNMKTELEMETVRCPCGSWTRPKLLLIEGLKIRGSVCPKCGQTYLNGADAMRLSEHRKRG